jgi:hypothetical protein
VREITVATTDPNRALTRSSESLPAAPDLMPSGMRAVALLSDAEFEKNLELLKEAQERTRRIQQTLMTEGRDYGIVPGPKKPTLLKPGAEILTLAYGFVARVETDFLPGDGRTTPHITYNATCYVHIGSWDGPVVAVGHGSANSWETKYRFRQTFGGRICPGCGKPGLIQTRANRDRPEQYWHPADARPDGGCGENFPLTATVESRPGEKVENTDPYDLLNTIEKMSDKRAHVAAILRATGTSGLFTVEEEDDKAKESPEVRARREFNEWVAEVGLEPREMTDLGKMLYPNRDLRKIAVWERTAWRAIAERDLLYVTDEQHDANIARIRGEVAGDAPQSPTGQQAPPAAAQAPSTPPPAAAPRNVTPAASQEEEDGPEPPTPEPPTPQQQQAAAAAVRADVEAAPAGPGGIGKSAEAVAAAVSQRGGGAGRMWTADELADLEALEARR